MNVEQATGVNANKNLLLLNILSIKYSVYDVKCDTNYCVYSLYCILCDMGKINVIDKILIKNLGKQKGGARNNYWKDSCLNADLGVDLIAC